MQQLPLQSASRSMAAAAMALLLVASSQAAAAPASAEGRVGFDNGAAADLRHGYFIVAPDTFAPHPMTRRLIFSTADVASKIAACAEATCAMVSPDDGLTIEIDPEMPMLRFWSRVDGKQFSGMVPIAEHLTLSSDSEARMAGTLKFNSIGVTADLQFDLDLTRTFPPKQ